jgi:metal-dependent amidase/aminoacylase/carboxypeptidase family protein
VSRRLDPFMPAVVSLGSIHAGRFENVIPDRVEISGTIRFMEPDIQKQIHGELERALKIANALGGDAELNIVAGNPPMINERQTTRLIQAVASDLLGKENVLPPIDNLGAEDFGSFLEQVPGAMFALGCRIEGDERSLHSPFFNIDEECLPVGAALLAETAWRALDGLPGNGK